MHKILVDFGGGWRIRKRKEGKNKEISILLSSWASHPYLFLSFSFLGSHKCARNSKMEISSSPFFLFLFRRGVAGRGGRRRNTARACAGKKDRKERKMLSNLILFP